MTGKRQISKREREAGRAEAIRRFDEVAILFEDLRKNDEAGAHYTGWTRGEEKRFEWWPGGQHWRDWNGKDHFGGFDDFVAWASQGGAYGREAAGFKSASVRNSARSLCQVATAAPGPRFSNVEEEPDAGLSRLLGLTLAERGVLTTILTLIDQADGPIRDNRPFIACWCGEAPVVTDPIIDRLVELGRLVIVEDDGRRCLAAGEPPADIEEKRTLLAQTGDLFE